MCWCRPSEGWTRHAGMDQRRRAQPEGARGLAAPRGAGQQDPAVTPLWPGSPFPSYGLPLPLPITCRQRKPPASPLPQVPGEKWV